MFVSAVCFIWSTSIETECFSTHGIHLMEAAAVSLYMSLANWINQALSVCALYKMDIRTILSYKLISKPSQVSTVGYVIH